MADKQFYRTVITIEVLSEEPVAFENLGQVEYAITDGPCSGEWHMESMEQVTPEKMARLLWAQGSDPNFFGLEGIQLCNICGKPAEGEDTCECVCPKCSAHCFDDSCISDHGMCFDCHKKWQFEEKGE